VLHWAHNPSTDEMLGRNELYRDMQRYLSKALNVEVALHRVSGYSSVVEAMRAGKVDFASLSPMTYVVAGARAGAEVVAIPGDDKGPGTYQSCIIVRADSPIRTMADLVRDSKKLTFAFVDPASTSGHLMPRAFLESQGVAPETGFRKIMFSQQHLNSVFTVVSGKVDAAATMVGLLKTLIERGKIRESDLRILWTSGPIPQSPVIVQKQLPEETKKRIQKAFLELHEHEPELAKVLGGLTKRDVFRYHAGSDKDYDPVREIARNVKSIQFLEE
jgi:phosphonate transport system substrate-binding protein